MPISTIVYWILGSLVTAIVIVTPIIIGYWWLKMRRIKKRLKGKEDVYKLKIEQEKTLIKEVENARKKKEKILGRGRYYGEYRPEDRRRATAVGVEPGSETPNTRGTSEPVSETRSKGIPEPNSNTEPNRHGKKRFQFPKPTDL